MVLRLNKGLFKKSISRLTLNLLEIYLFFVSYIYIMNCNGENFFFKTMYLKY